MLDKDAGKIEAGTPAFRRVTVAAFSCGFSIFAILYCPQPVLPLLTQEFGITPAQSSLTVSLPCITMAVAMLFVSSLSDVLGRKPLMMAALALSSVFTLALYWADSWASVLWLRALAGVALSGAPAVSLAYLSDEIHPKAVTHAVGLYVGGSALGGMAGRLAAAGITDIGSWRLAMVVIALTGFVSLAVFWRALPPSRHFKAAKGGVVDLMRSMFGLLRVRTVVLLVIVSFFGLGSFMTLFNYLGFRLQAEPFNLSQTVAGLVFLAYPIGSVGSAFFGARAAKYGRGPVLIVCSSGLFVALALMMPDSLITLTLGLALLTFCFFGAHAICSSWAPAAAPESKAQASSLYLLLYYVGGGVAGSVGGIFWAWNGWTGVALFCGSLMLGILCVAIALSRTAQAR